MKWIWVRDPVYGFDGKADRSADAVNVYAEFLDSFDLTFDCELEGAAVPDKSAGSADKHSKVHFFPKDKLKLLIAADSQYALWVNGRFAAMGQYADWPHAKVYDTLDISDFMREGRNELKFLIYYQGQSSSTYFHGQAGFCYRLCKGSETVTESDEHTLGRIAPGYRSGPMEMVSGQLGFAFEFDATNLSRLSPYFPAFDTGMALRLAEYPLKSISDGKTSLYPRPIEKLKIGSQARVRVNAQGLFKFCAGSDNEVTAKRLQEAMLSARRAAELTSPRLRTGTYLGGADIESTAGPSVLSQIHYTTSTGNGFDGIYVLLDLGAESAGYFDLDIEAPAGTKVYAGYGEQLEDLRVRSYVGGRCFTGVYTCRGGREQFTHYNKRLGLRYLQLYVTAFDFTLYYAGIRPADYPLENVLKLRTSDSLHNKIYATSLDTLRLCMHEHYEDCPWREQALYAMDSRNQMLAGYYAYGEYAFPKASLRLLMQGLRSDGMMELCAPAKVSVDIPGFSLMWIVAVYEYVLYSGDYEFASECSDTVEKIIHEFWVRSRGSEQLGPWKNQGDWNFYEWSDWMVDSAPASLRQSGRDNSDAALTLFYALALSAAETLSGWLIRNHAANDRTDYRQLNSWYSMLHKSVISAFHNCYWNPERGAYASYIVNGHQIHYSELVNSLALYAGAVPEEYTEKVAQLLTGRHLPNFIGYKEEIAEFAPGCPEGFVPVTLSHSVFKYEALCQLGDEYAEFVFNDIAAKWGHMLYNGATSFWETLDGAEAFDDAGSLCHGWSAIPVIIYAKYALGIAPEKPGFTAYRFNPLKTPLLECSGNVPVPNDEVIRVNISHSVKDYRLGKR